MHEGVYHKVLRVSIVAIVFVLIFDSGIITPLSKELSDNTINYLASGIGVVASVPPNELNEITAELTAKEQELNQREANLATREIATRDFGEERDISIYVLSTIIFILTVLIVLNYAMDWLRVKELYRERKAH